MGLDMYANRTKIDINNPGVDFNLGDNEYTEIAYWRKHPNLHRWMEKLYREKGGEAESFNTVGVALTSADIDRLETDVMRGTLPQNTGGYFFGSSTDEDREDDLKFIKAAREAFADGEFVFYTSWW